MDNATFTANEAIWFLPLEDAFLMPASSTGYMAVRVINWGVLAVWGMISNTVCAALLIKSKLYKSWTYTMILNLCVSDFLFCTNSMVLRLPGVAMGR